MPDGVKGRPARVLIVDDSVVARRFLSETLAEDPEIEVAGTASDGRIALAKLTQLDPDVVVLDVVMPVMDGIATLKEIRLRDSNLPVIMFSSVTERGADATLEALFRGATDYVSKPSDMRDLQEARAAVRQQLIPKIKTFSRHLAVRREVSRAAAVAERRFLRRSARSDAAPADVVAVAASTGGPRALRAVLQRLPSGVVTPWVIVQHMPPIFTRQLARHLDSVSHLQIRDAEDGAEVKPGTAWVARGGSHMVVVRSGRTVRIETNQDAEENSCRPSADVLFRSVAEVFGRSALAVVLTGMGRDGLRGSEAIRARGGRVLAQDQATSVVWGMPGFVAGAGLADGILPIEGLSGEIAHLAGGSRSAEAAREGS